MPCHAIYLFLAARPRVPAGPPAAVHQQGGTCRAVPCHARTEPSRTHNDEMPWQVYWDHVMELRLGYSPAEVLGKHPMEILGFDRYALAATSHGGGGGFPPLDTMPPLFASPSPSDTVTCPQKPARPPEPLPDAHEHSGHQVRPAPHRTACPALPCPALPEARRGEARVRGFGLRAPFLCVCRDVPAWPFRCPIVYQTKAGDLVACMSYADIVRQPATLHPTHFIVWNTGFHPYRPCSTQQPKARPSQDSYG
jgi:hypothetical protein